MIRKALFFYLVFFLVNQVHAADALGKTGVDNQKERFVKALCKKYKLEPFTTKVKYEKKSYVFKEYRNLKSKLIVSFSKNGKSPVTEKLNRIYIYSKDQKKLMNVAKYFISKTKTDKIRKKQWKKYLSSLAFNAKPGQFFEYGGIPQLRCLTHKIQRDKSKKVIYYLEITILE